MASQVFSLMGIAIAVLVILEALLWLVAYRRGNAAIVDVGWGMGFVLVVLIALVFADGFILRKALVAAIVALWGLRLAVHLFVDRILPNKPEDGRYVELRRRWGEAVQRRLFVFFEIQGVLVVLLSLPFYLMAVNPEPCLLPIELAGAAVWFVGIAGESVADRQLKRFKDPPANKGKTCQVGLWSLSRHPNYFFEWIIWVGYGVAALGSPYGWLGLLSTAAMLYILLNVTGIPLTEEQALRSRSDYREYQRTTSRFIPWFKRA